MSHSEIAPQTMLVAAPPDVIMAVIVSARNSSRLGSALSLRRMADPTGRILVKFTTVEVVDPDPVIKELIPDPPDRVCCCHIAGPYVGTVEDIRLVPVDGGTAITVTGLYSRDDGTARLVRHILEEGAREYLADLKHMAEPWARRLGALPTARTQVPPVLTSEEEALEAIGEQEREEWGHSGHGRGVARVAVALAQQMHLPEQHLEDVRQAAALHDIGKVALDSQLWGSLQTLSLAQRKQMEVHVRLGADLAERAQLRAQVVTTILRHHERWDGYGYPGGLVGNAIPLRARVVGLAESVDTMMRPSYRREALPPARVIAVLQRGAGRVWDPVLANCVIRMLQGQATSSANS